MRSRVSAILGSFVTSAALVLTLPGAAHAAQGTFEYHKQPGSILEILNNPVDNRCYNIGDARGAADNGTNRYAELYSAPGCRGDVVQTLDPGTGVDWIEFQGVKFTR
ncbi:hypothetical protein [Streptomyces uncialis]|uniref:hypothetical protein n=1 Tax=Streptomyces uncialis TaxID=1048205 RepID=UPI003863AF6A|nr:hypothetical protein OG268_36525 [Streptomyces uncialis]